MAAPEQIDELFMKKRRLPQWISSSTPTPSTNTSSTVASFPKSQQQNTITTKRISKKVILSNQKEQDQEDFHHHLHPIEEEDKDVEVKVDLNNTFRSKSKSKSNKKKRITINKSQNNNNHPNTHCTQVKQDDADEQQQGEENQQQEKEELTVDDLMIIAREYVNAEDGKEDYQEGVESFGKQTTALSRYDDDDDESTGGSSHDIEVLLSNIHTSVGVDLSNSNHLSNQEMIIIPNSRETGDPAKDMLDLFLGPFLKKNYNRRDETYREEIALDNWFRKEASQNDGEELGKQVVPTSTSTLTLMKKKTSLRDKVAMFLD